MADGTPGADLAPGVVKVLAALAELGEATAAGVAAHAGMAYSTTTSRLRKLEETGLAEPFRAADRRTVWRPTSTGKAAARVVPAAATGSDNAEPELRAAAPAPDPDVEDAPGRPEPLAGQPDPDHPGNTASAPAGQPDDHRPRTQDPGHAEDGPDTPGSTGGGPCGDPRMDQPPGGAATPSVGGRPRRRPKGALRAAVVDILEDHPDRQYRVGELCKLINAVQHATGLPKASLGAVANVMDKLVIAGIAVQTLARPATYQLAPGPRAGLTNAGG